MKRFLTALLCVIAALSIFQTIVHAQSVSRDDVLNQIETKRMELQKLEEQFLAPSKDDRDAYAEFLKQADTGLIRLLPRETYDDEKKLTIRGGGAYYSFARLTHAYGNSDLELQHGYFSVGFAGANYGAIVKTGEVALEELSIDHPGLSFLSAYKAASDEPQARIEQHRFGSGTTIAGVMYSDRVKADVGSTYVLRSINYSDSDVLVAFKVVRRDADGSLIIAWKLLKRYPKPELARANSNVIVN